MTFDRLSFEQIYDEYQPPSVVVKARIHRGKKRLKKELLSICQFSCDERNELTCEPKGK